MDPIDTSDQALIAAIRRRLLQEIEREQAGGASVVNNVYGGGAPIVPSEAPSQGLMGQMGGQAGATEDPYDYFVDIVRKDLPEINPETGKPIGWEKSVRRHRGLREKSGLETLDEKKKNLSF